ncbi:hypothetical protein R1sor_011095 [Riccia sorocarpa]|uniref:Uncharacterized protein n=1 Tax=Riccia sorocarpa TaxID=122646 RepID=A0ABD3I3D2_9MARC
MVTLTRKDTSSLLKIGSMALEEALTNLEQAGLRIEEVVHDDNAQQLKDLCKDNGIQTTVHDLAYKLKSRIYTCSKDAAIRGDTDPTTLTLDIQNAADHWARNHETCRNLPGTRKCVTENAGPTADPRYVEGSVAGSSFINP